VGSIRSSASPRSGRVVAALTAAVLVSACANVGLDSAPRDARERVGTVAIVPSEEVPRSNFLTFSKGRPQGAAIEAIEFEGCVVRFPFDLKGCPGGTYNPALALTLKARARLVVAASGEELFARGFRYHSPRRELARWVADDGRLLTEELERAYQDLAERIHDAFFLTSSTEIAIASTLTGLPGSSPDYGLCWLAPRAPAARPVLVSEMWTLPFAKGEICELSAIRFPVVDSLQPLLRWDAFPRAADSRAVHAVTYDLKVWEVEDCARRAPAYERSGLTLPEHRLETPLIAGQRYFWSVRARFTARGRPQATPWSFFAPGTTCELAEIPDGQWHRFATPREP
jgi:hypothetical protein